MDDATALPAPPSVFVRAWRAVVEFVRRADAPLLEQLVLAFVGTAVLIWYVAIHIVFLFERRLAYATPRDYAQIIANDDQYQTLSSIYVLRSRYPYFWVVVLLGVLCLFALAAVLLYVLLVLLHKGEAATYLCPRSPLLMAMLAFSMYVCIAFLVTLVVYAKTRYDVTHGAGKRAAYEANLAKFITTDKPFLDLLRSLPVDNVKINPYVAGTATRRVDGLAFDDEPGGARRAASLIFTYRLYMHLMQNVAAHDVDARREVKQLFTGRSVLLGKLGKLAFGSAFMSTYMTRGTIFVGANDYSSFNFIAKNVLCTDAEVCAGKLGFAAYYKKYRADVEAALQRMLTQLQADADISNDLAFGYTRVRRMVDWVTVVNGWAPVGLIVVASGLTYLSSENRKVKYGVAGGIAALAALALGLRSFTYGA
jgi:hypothetical protein